MIRETEQTLTLEFSSFDLALIESLQQNVEPGAVWSASGVVERALHDAYAKYCDKENACAKEKPEPNC